VDEERSGYAIPPDREAVQAALQPKKRPPNPALILVIFCVIGGLGFFILPKLGRMQQVFDKEPPTTIIDPIYGETRKHKSSIRLLVDLPPSRTGQKRSELNGELIFTFAADHDDFTAAEEAIEVNWDTGARAARDLIAKHSRLEHIRDQAKIFFELRAALDRSFFPDGRGRIAQLEWLELNLH